MMSADRAFTAFKEAVRELLKDEKPANLKAEDIDGLESMIDDAVENKVDSALDDSSFESRLDSLVEKAVEAEVEREVESAIDIDELTKEVTEKLDLDSDDIRDFDDAVGEYLSESTDIQDAVGEYLRDNKPDIGEEIGEYLKSPAGLNLLQNAVAVTVTGMVAKLFANLPVAQPIKAGSP